MPSGVTHAYGMQHTATWIRVEVSSDVIHAYGMQHTSTRIRVEVHMGCKTLQLGSTHMNASRSFVYTCTQAHAVPHRTKLQHAATRCDTLQHAVPHRIKLQHTATRCNTLQYIATRCTTSQQATTCCNMLQHITTSRNTLRNTANKTILKAINFKTPPHEP